MDSSLARSLTSEDLSFLADGAISDEDEDWEHDVADCRVCSRRFGPLVRRHHCRICGKCVCAKCSPSSVMLSGGDGRVQRACNPCISHAQRGPVFKKRMVQLSRRLFALSGIESHLEPKTMDEAIVLCETALSSLEETHLSLKQRAEVAEAEMVIEQERHQCLAADVFLARDFISQMEEKVITMLEGVVPASRRSSEMKLEESMACCEQAFLALKQSVGIKVSVVPLRCGERKISNSSLETTATSSIFASSASDTTLSPLRSFEAVARCDVWESNKSSCTVCGTMIGKRHFNRRHHCRICGRCVCGSCSPHSILLEGRRHAERTCTPCVSLIHRAPALKRRVLFLADKLQVLQGVHDGASNPLQAMDLEHAVALCESVVAPFETLPVVSVGA